MKMDGKEYERAIGRLALTQVGAARFLDVSDTTSRRWKSNAHPIPHATAMLLRAMVLNGMTPDAVAKIRRVK
jgi:hypothetical protein